MSSGSGSGSGSGSSGSADDSSPPPYTDDVDCEVFFDLSRSMKLPANHFDCEGQDRFAQGTEASLEILDEFIKLDTNGITIGYYNSSFDMIHNVADSDAAIQYFATLRAKIQKGTQLAPLLKNRFDDFRKTYPDTGRRRIIVIVTDGMTGDFIQAKKEIRDMANWEGLPNGEVLGVSFLVVGDDADGDKMCRRLDHLKDEDPSVRNDIVDAKTIDWLNRHDVTVADFVSQGFID